MKELLLQAEKENRAVGAFSVGNMEMVIGALKAAEEMNTPVIIQIAEVRLRHSPLACMAPMMVQAAREAKVPVAVHLDHGLSMEVLCKAIGFGFSSVMFDGSSLPFEENISETKKAVHVASKYKVTTEAELGVVGGSEDGSANHKIKYTDPEQAKRFVLETGVDALAVAIGNAHGHYATEPKLNFEVLETIRNCVDVPLVLHGGSGISAQDFRKCIDHGVRKINIATASFTALTKSAENYLKTEEPHNYFALNEAMIDGVLQNVKNCIYIFNNKGEI
ncbi:MAG: class II aldolase [Lacrimispora sp.]|uniref:class II fructose-bisphosphate aldolase n=1 Tax=Lacrimispora sp. TaxID=2719234 RepID=UPI0039E6284B